MKILFILSLLLFSSNGLADQDTNFYRCENDKRVNKKILKQINQELRCIDEKTLQKDFNKIYKLVIHPYPLNKKRRITLIRGSSSLSNSYKDKIFMKHEYDISNEVKSGFSKPVIRELKIHLKKAVNIACDRSFNGVNDFGFMIKNSFEPVFINIKSEQLDQPKITKAKRFDSDYSKYTFSIFDFEASYECMTLKEAQAERIRKIAERVRKIEEEESLEQERIARAKKEEEDRKELERLEELEKKKSLCREIGAEDNSSDMIMCVTRLMEIEKMSEIADENKQQAIADRNRVLNEIARTNEQIRKDEQARRQGQALMNLGAAISGGGTTGSPSSIPSIIPTPPVSQPRYSKTLTVDSNKNCPILVDALVKQEVFGLNRICYYR